MKLLSKTMTIYTALILLTWVTSLWAEDEAMISAKRIVVAPMGLATPESVEYYADEDVYLVTNINGSPLEADGNGFISKIRPNGSLVDLKWIDGTKDDVELNAPKGAAIQGNILYVTDIDHVRLFELPSGRQKASIHIPGSTFLNGITPGNGDFVYVTDSGLKAGEGGFVASGTDAIYKVSANGAYEAIVKDKDMGRPNGIVTDDSDLVIVTFGSGEVFRLDSTGKRQDMPSPPKGSLDGLIKLEDGRFVMTSWEGSALYALDQDGEYTTLADALDSPADIGYDTKRNRVLVPLFQLNQIVLLSL